MPGKQENMVSFNTSFTSSATKSGLTEESQDAESTVQEY